MVFCQSHQFSASRGSLHQFLPNLKCLCRVIGDQCIDVLPDGEPCDARRIHRPQADSDIVASTTGDESRHERVSVMRVERVKPVFQCRVQSAIRVSLEQKSAGEIGSKVLHLNDAVKIERRDDNAIAALLLDHRVKDLRLDERKRVDAVFDLDINRERRPSKPA